MIFGLWAVACFYLVWKRRLLLWIGLWLPPLILVSLDWIYGNPEQAQFGYYPWGALSLFTGISLVVAATGIVSILRAREAA